jgi:DNA-binding Xre family transcriptional regulator
MSTTHTTKPATAPPDPIFFTRKELTQRWGVSDMFIHRMREMGKLPVVRLGGRGLRFRVADILRIEEESTLTGLDNDEPSGGEGDA